MFKRSFLCLSIVTTLLFVGCLIKGRIVDENGAGVAGVNVTLSGPASMTTTTDSNGDYQFGTLANLLITGDYTVTPSGDFTPTSRNVTISNLTLENGDVIPWPEININFNKLEESFSYWISFNEGSPNPLTVQTILDNQPVELPVTALALTGTYNTGTLEITANNNSTISVDTTENLFGELEIKVKQIAKWISGKDPTEGSFEIRSGTDIILLSVNPNVGGSPGVDITFENNTTSLTWSDLEEIEENPNAPEHQQISMFGLGIFVEFFFERATYAIEAVQSIKNNETAIEAAGSQNVGLRETCDQFPPQSGLSGNREYRWIDASSNGDLDSGDRFVITYDSNINGCWYNDPTDNIDTLINGTLELNNYVKILDGANNLIGVNTVVLFDNFVEQETEDSMVLDDFTLRTDGGFNMFLTLSN